MRPDANIARQFLLVGATLLAVGIALSGVGQTSGGVITVIALALLIAGLHTYGRAGPDGSSEERG